MMKFTLEIELGSDAMRSRNDVEEALRKLGQNVGYMSEIPAAGDDGVIKDYYGNDVGKWEVAAEDAAEPFDFAKAGLDRVAEACECGRPPV